LSPAPERERPPGEARPVRVAFFGRTAEPLSLAGLEEVLRCPQARVVSVTAGRGTATSGGDGPLHQLARRHGIPLHDFAGVRSMPEAPELVVSFSNPVVFPAAFLESIRLGAVNLHPAPLPRYRGCHAIEHAIIEGALEFGTTLHYCEASIDTGPVIDIATFPIGPDDTARDVWRRVDELSIDLLRRTLPRLVGAAGTGRRLDARPQDPAAARYFADDSLPRELELDLTLAPETLRRLARAYDHPRRPLPYVSTPQGRLRLRASGRELCVAGLDPPG